MTPEAWTFLGALVLACIAWMAVTKNRDDLRRLADRLAADNEGLREQLDAEQESAARWYREATQGRNVTPSWAGERPDLAAHIADALAVVEPRNVVRFPGQRGS